MIEFIDVDAGYGKRVKLQSICCQFRKGTMAVIVGPNGSGKSTLLKTIMGMTSRMRGQILLDGKSIESYSRIQTARKIAFLPQNRNVPFITVERMILHGRFPYLSYGRNYSQADYQLVEQVLSQYQLTELRERPLYELSGGERQKVYLAMAQVQDSEYYLFDEPTTYLDIGYQFEFLNHLVQLKQQGKTCLVVLHDLAAALQIADEILVLDHGKIEFSGTCQEALKQQVLDRVFRIQVHTVRAEETWYHISRNKVR